MAVCLLLAMEATARDVTDVTFKAGRLRVSFMEKGKQFNVEWRSGKGYRPVVMGSVPEAVYDVDGGGRSAHQFGLVFIG